MAGWVDAAHGNPPTLANDVVSLAGEWLIRLDPENRGVEQKWSGAVLPDGPAGQSGKGRLPGSTDENKLGTPRNPPADLDRLNRLVEYYGAAWYQRDIEIPEAWKGKRIALFLEYCHWETQVWVDERFCGMADSMAVAHVHDLGAELTPGKHRLTIRVDNTIKYNLGGTHAYIHDTQTNWNGVVGRIELRATDPVWIDDLQVYPDVDKKTARVAVRVGNATAQTPEVSIDLRADPTGAEAVGPQTASTKGRLKPNQPTTFEIELPMGSDARLWDEFSPALYNLSVALSCDAYRDQRQVCFGMRKLTVENKRLVLNDRKIFLRGTLECCIFPLTGYPSMDVEAWLRILRICRSYGLNHMRFHSWCPPEAAFVAADQMGFLLQVESPVWVFDWGADQRRNQYVQEEIERILDAYGNHPSFGLFSVGGNEPGGDQDVLFRFVKLAQERDRRHLYTASSCRSNGTDDDFCVAKEGEGVRGPATTDDLREALANPKEKRWVSNGTTRLPVISHECGQWTVYPNLEAIEKYTGVLRNRRFEVVRDELAKKRLLEQAGDFFRASGLWSMQLYKEDIELELRTPGLGGFQLLDLRDYPGQGYACWGLLDPFWDPKGLITPERYQRFCGPTVPLARFPTRTYTADEPFLAQIEVAHYGAADLPDARVVWTIKDSEGREVASGAFAPKTLPTGELTTVGKIETSLAKAAPPTGLTLTVAIEGTSSVNDWNLWVYPSRVDTTPDEVVVTTAWDVARTALADGKRVLLLATPATLAKSVPMLFTTPFWQPISMETRAPRGETMGILCDPTHPALAQFPTAFHTDWQWYDPIMHSSAMVIDDLPAELCPVVRVVDAFTKNRRLTLLFEGRVGEGRLMVSSIDLKDGLDERPASRQLLASILAYMRGNAFEPKDRLDVETLSRFFHPISDIRATVVHTDSAAPDHPGANATDGDAGTYWLTDGTTGHPHEIQIDLHKPVLLKGVFYLPRQDLSDGRIQNYSLPEQDFDGGRIEGFEVYASNDGTQWGAPAAKGTFPTNTYERQKVLFDAPQQARFVRFVVVSKTPKKYASIAELEAIVEK